MGVAEWYHYLNTEVSDPRSNNWFLISSPVPLILITFAYLYFVLQCGPRFMENRKPYSFKTFIRFYNLMQIVWNGLIVYHIFDAGWYQNYFFYCTDIDYTTNPTTMKIAEIMWYTFLLKIIDYIETGLFVLRKKQRQVSFLHLYHHVSTVLIGWVFVKYYTNGMVLTIMLINCGVHVIMYTYYLLASYGSTVQQYLNSVKSMVTILQMVQFIVLIIYTMQGLIPACKDVKYPFVIMMVNLIINFYLFYQFYQHTYTKKNKQL